MSRKLLTTLAFGGALVAAPIVGQATVIIEYSINGGGPTTLCSGAGGCVGSTSSSGVTITFQSATSNSPGTPQLADLLSAVATLSNSGGSAATVQLYIGDTGYTAPTSPPALDLHSQIGDTVVFGGLGGSTLQYVSCIDQGNGQNTCPSGTVIAPTLNANLGLPSDNEFNDTIINSLAAPFSMSEYLNITLASGAIINYSASTNLSPIPEPASLAILGSALVGFGWLGRRRRKTS